MRVFLSKKCLKGILLLPLSVLFIISFGLVLCSEKVLAASDLKTKSEMAAVYACYTNGKMRGSLTPASWKTSGATALTSGASVYVLDASTSSLKNVTCSSLFSDTFSSKMPAKTASQDSLNTFFFNMGYTVDTSGAGDGYCAIYRFTNASGESSTTTMCAPSAHKNDDGVVVIGDTKLTYSTDGATAVTLANRTGNSFSTNTGINCNGGSLAMNCTSPHGITNTTITYTANTSFESHANAVFQTIYSYNQKNLINGAWNITGSQAEITGNEGTVSYNLDAANRSSAGLKAIRYLFNDNSITSENNFKLSTDEQAQLLTSAMNDYYNFAFFGGSESSGCNLDETGKSNATSLGYIEFQRSKDKICYVKATKNDKSNVMLFNKGTGTFTGSSSELSMNFSETVQTLSDLVEDSPGDLSLSLSPSPISGSDPSGSDPSDPSGGTDTSETPFCTQVSGVLSWVFCPVLNFVGETVGKIYEWIEDSFLTVPASVMSQDSGTYDGWAQFRNFANILFAVLFAIVILSQITGIGISNYNVKKMLPRLIMVVVLVNISFILCQLAVDLSNLVGHGINQLLSGFAEGGTFNLGAVQGLTTALVSGTTADVEASFSGLWGGIGTAAAVLAAVATWKLWLLPLLLALVSALIAVVFFFLILGVRQAGVIIMVVLAPMAIVCYALPNTKSLFDKWWKIFSALLMVYPICGAMMGGGTFAASIMIANDPGNFLYFIIAMLLTIAPFFFIPSVLRNSLNGVASLGSKFAKLGGGLGKDARRIAERSNTFQDAKSQLGYRRAQAAMNRYEGKGLVGRGIKKLSSSKLGQAVGKSPVGALGRGIGVMGDYVGKKTGITAARQRSYMRNAKLAAQGKRIQYEANNADSFLAGEESRQRATDISNAKARYLLDKGSPIDTGDYVSMQKEYDKQLDALLANPEDDSAIANVAALQDIMSATDDGAAVMMSSLALKANEIGQLSDGDERKEIGKRALRKAASNIDAGAFKSRNRNYYKMATDFANGNFRPVEQHGLGTYDGDVKDKEGKKIPPLSYLKGYHGSPAALKYSAANFGSLDNSAYRQILTGVQNGEITGTNLQNLMETINEAVSNDNIHLDNNAADYAQQILSAGYARSADGGVSGGSGGSSAPSVTRTAGSQAIAHAASVKSINNLTSRVQNGAIKPEEAVKIANNMLTSVRDNTNSFSAEKLAAMKNYASAVNQLGATDSSGQPINFDTREFDSARIDVHGGRTSSTPTPAPTPTPTPSAPSTRPGTVSGTQIIQTPNPGGSTTTQVRGWSGQIIGGGSSETTTPGGIILTGDAADQLRNSSRQQGNNQQGGQGGNGGGSTAP